jgi:glycosyltransferase involved in cell wall biosynthesis
MNQIPKVAWIYTINPGVTFYRYYQFLQRMSEKELVNSFLFPDWDPTRLLSPDWEEKLDQYMGTFEELLKTVDMMVIQYVATAQGIALVQALRDKLPVFMEVDDYFSAVPSYSCAYQSNMPGDRQDVWATRQMIESTGLVCSTQYLADHGRKYNGNVHVIPNCINPFLWKMEPRSSNGKVRIGWVGGATHEGDLKIVKDVLYELLSAHPNLEVMICSGPPPDWPKHERLLLVNKWVTIDKYPEMVKSLNFDIGIAPLRDNYFNRSKSNLRFLEMSAMKIPTVASSVEPFKHDFCGYLCATDQEWFDTLSMLITSPSQREQDGLKAYDQVTTKFNLDKISMDYYGLILEATGRESKSVPASN